MPGTAAVVNAVAKEKFAIGYGGAAYAKGIKILKVKKDDRRRRSRPSDATMQGRHLPAVAAAVLLPAHQADRRHQGVHRLGAVDRGPGDRRRRSATSRSSSRARARGRAASSVRGTLAADGSRPIAISLGDPCGIGPEIVARALAARPDARRRRLRRRGRARAGGGRGGRAGAGGRPDPRRHRPRPGRGAAGQTERRGGPRAARVPGGGDDRRAGGRGGGAGDGADLEAVDRARRVRVSRAHRVSGVARRRARVRDDAGGADACA